MRRASMCVSVGLLLAGTAAGCGIIDSSEFQGGVPTREAVALQLPGASASGALTAEGGVSGTQSALLGEKADTYQTTRDITAAVNGGTWAVLTLVRTVIDFPASSVHGDTAVWGPHTDPLSPNTWRLTVTRVEPHKFHWLFDARAKVADDSAFMTIIEGTHTAAVDGAGHNVEGFGSGAFVIDWDAAAKLPDHDDNVGRAAFTYARPTPVAVTTVDVDFKGIQDKKTGEIFDAVYRYTATPGAGGDLRYAADQDVTPGPGPTGTAKEHFTVHSRWQETGAGRCDIQASGGDLAATNTVVTGSECWDSNFLSVYKNLSYDPTGGWGAEASCAFIPAEYAGL